MSKEGEPKEGGFFWEGEKEKKDYEAAKNKLDGINKQIEEENKRHKEILDRLNKGKEELEKKLFEAAKKI